MRKKIMLAVLIACICVNITGCNKNDKAQEAATAGDSSIAVEESRPEPTEEELSSFSAASGLEDLIDSEGMNSTSAAQPIDQKNMLGVVQDVLQQYRDDSISSIEVSGREMGFEEVPAGVALPVVDSYDQLEVFENAMMGGYNVSVPTRDGAWTMHIWVTDFTYSFDENDIPEVGYMVSGVSFMANE